MPPKAPKASSSSTRISYPAPNRSHPCSSLIPPVLASSCRSHSPSYHSFITSPYLPILTESSNKGKRSRPKSELPPVQEGAISASVLHSKLLTWFDGVREDRKMPWRKDGDPREMKGAERTQRGYEVWVSEIMLQQTQVATCIDYWNNFMERFPTVKDLAKADVEDVNAMWKGLGYYSRASRLLLGAKKVVDEFDGKMPETVEDLLTLDGIGPYSAGAISSIAYGQRAAMVDGNIIRVLSRLTAFHSPSTSKSTTDYIWSSADVLVPSLKTDVPPLSTKKDEKSPGGPNKAGSWNQALMELGATVCTPMNPDCSACPLSEECLAYQEVRTLAHPSPTSADTTLPDLEDLCDVCSPFDVRKDHLVTRYPMAKEKKKVREEETAVCLLEWRSGATKKVLLVKRPEKGLLAGLFEFPSIDLPPPPAPESTLESRLSALQSHLSSLLSNKISLSTLKSSKDLGSVLQVYSHQKRMYHIHRLVLSSGAEGEGEAPELREDSRARWVPEDDVAGSNIGGAVVKVWEVRNNGQPAKKEKKESVKKVVKVVVDEKQTKLSFAPAATAAVSVDITKKKKRVIVISDDEEE